MTTQDFALTLGPLAAEKQMSSLETLGWAMTSCAHSCAACRGERTATKNRAVTSEGLISALGEPWSKICPGENRLIPVPRGRQTTEAVTLL